MASENFSSAVLRAKFRGCMIGGLMGDCLGLTFEFMFHVPSTLLNKFLTEQMSKEESMEVLRYSDDTSMALSIAESLIDKGEIDVKDIAKRFVDDYFREPNRGHGKSVRDVFYALRESNFDDVFLPAKRQFNGKGSYGNGAAMRIAPIALFGNNKSEQYVMNAAVESSRITHTHQHAVNGGILQCLAVNTVLGLDPSKSLDPVDFINSLLEKMENIEPKSLLTWFRRLWKEDQKDESRPYCEALKKIKEMYLQNQDQNDITLKEIVDSLGNGFDVSAAKSVPVAIYSFLRGLKPLKDYESSNPFMRALYFAISVGGDTDTIACMAGSIAGAYHGVDMIPEVLQKRCEALDEVTKTADKLFDAAQKKD